MRLFLRLTTDVNDRLRTLMRYQGELSRYIDEALTSSDPASVELVPAALGRTSHAITAVISDPANGQLRAAAKRRGCSVTLLANSALHKWLGGKHACCKFRRAGSDRRPDLKSVGCRGAVAVTLLAANRNVGHGHSVTPVQQAFLRLAATVTLFRANSALAGASGPVGTFRQIQERPADM